ncbi:hypothetical protein ACWGI8_12895 [Streptomyces sp. NPDC054841]
MKRSFSLALSTSVVLGVLAVPHAASAAAGPTTVGVSGLAQKPGHLFVDDLKADSEVTGISAVIHRPGENVAVETVHDFTLASGDRKTGDWITTGEVRLELAGTYAVNLIVREADGDETFLENAGTYDYTAKRYFEEFGVDRPQPTFDDLKVTASGRLVDWQPVTHERKPVAGASIRLHSSSDPTDVDWLTTDADGRFTDWFIAEDGPLPVFAYNGNVRTQTVTVTPKGLPARVTLDKADFRGKYNAPVTVTGKVEYELGGAWRTAKWADVEIVDAKGLFNGSAVTDADGRFSAETKIPFAGDKRQLIVSNGDWFSNKPTVPLTFRTTAITSISQFQVALGSDSRLTASGSVNVEGAPRPHTKVDIQVSKDGRTSWAKLGTLTGTSSGFFLGSVAAPATGYYRAVWFGSTDVPTAVSPVLHASGVPTRITGYKVSPTVRKGGLIAVSGTLQHLAPTWKGYGAREVRVYFSPKGKPKESYLLGTVRTAANGSFTKSFKERGDGTVFALHQNVDAKHLVNPRVSGNVDVR